MADMNNMAKKTENIMLRTTSELRARLQAIADQEQRSLSWVLERALQDWLDWRERGYASEGGEESQIRALWARATPAQRRHLLRQAELLREAQEAQMDKGLAERAE